MFYSSQLFPENTQPSEMKERAVEVVNIVFGFSNSSDLKEAQELAKSHFRMLTQGLNQIQLDEILLPMSRAGINEQGLKRIAELYGYKLTFEKAPSGRFVHIKRLP